MSTAEDARSVDKAAGQPPGIARSLTGLLAVACGVAVASLYYAQPLLHTIAQDFHTSSGTAGLIVTASQVGYAVGLAFLVPAGDLFNRRRLVPAVLGLSAIALAVSAVAPGVVTLIALALVVGLGSVVAQLLVPMAASLAREEERGRVTGTVMSGLLIGILLARTLSGLVAGATTWRVVYWVAAGLVAALALVLLRALPSEGDRPDLGYGALLHSTVSLFFTEALLRRRMALGALCFASFGVFWTTAAFLLSGAPYHYGEAVIGLFGLVGAAGALCASFAGRMADRGRANLTTGVFSISIAGSFALLFAGRHSLAALIAGIVVLDVGVQGLHVTNQSLVFRLDPKSRSRVNANYMVAYFAGGAAGSAVAAALYSSGGWEDVCVLGAATGAGATALWIFDRLRPLRGR
ncbi:MAG TPA: MFS transporter [Acidimicrobiales bacterium]|nr:MFS transporter [Acidimicrobiales bacterium]